MTLHATGRRQHDLDPDAVTATVSPTVRPVTENVPSGSAWDRVITTPDWSVTTRFAGNGR